MRRLIGDALLWAGAVIVGAGAAWGAEAATGKADGSAAAPGVYAFDFGPAEIPPHPGFVRVDKQAVWKDGAAHGWMREVEWASARKSDYASGGMSIQHTLLEGDGTNTFRVTVPDGAYRIWLATGDLTWVPPAFSVSVNGREAIAERETINSIQRIQTWRFDAEAREGALALEFRGAPRFVVCGGVIAPVRDWERSAEPLAAAVEKELRLVPAEELKSWAAKEFVEMNPPPKATAEQQKAGFVVFSRPAIEPVYPNTIPAAGEVNRPVRGFAARGEFEPLTFGLYPLRTVKGLNAGVSELAGPDGARIGQEALVLRVAAYRAQSLAGHSGAVVARAYYEITEESAYRTVPELLERFRPMDLDETKLFWLTVHVPADAAPGAYSGRVTLSAPGMEPVEVPISLRVLPFSLPQDTPKTFGVYYNDPADIRKPELRAAYEARGTLGRLYERRRRDMEDLRDHGMQTLTLLWVNVVEKDGAVTYDPSLLVDVVEEGRKAGFIRRPMPCLGPNTVNLDTDVWKVLNKVPMPEGWKPPEKLSDDFVRKYTGGVRFLQELAKERNWPQILFNPIDEPGAGARRDVGKMLCRLTRQVPGARIFITGSYSLDYLDEEFVKLIDVVCFCDLYSVPDDPKQTKGNWYYPNCIIASSADAATARFGTGFGFWFSGLDGWCPWRYSAVWGSLDSDLDGRMTDFFFSYPMAEEHVPTLRWEQVREGVDDCRYLTVLEETIALAEKSGRQEAVRAAAEARMQIARLKGRTPTLRQFGASRVEAPAPEGIPQGRFDRERWAVSNLDGMRASVAQAILKLQAAMRGEPTPAGDALAPPL